MKDAVTCPRTPNRDSWIFWNFMGNTFGKISY